MRQTFRAGFGAALAGAVLASAVLAAGRAGAEPPETATVTTEQLGAGSVLAVVTHGRPWRGDADGLARSLEVITPDGVRHPVYSVALEETRAGWLPGDFTLADWRPELHTALLRVSLGADGDALVAYDVTAGTTRAMPAPRRASSVALAPDGTGVLMITYGKGRRPGRVGVAGWDGTRTWLPARADGPALTSVDGRTLVAAAGGARWRVVDLVARTATTVDTPGSCVPRRWLGADSVLATCWTRRGSRLRDVDLTGRSHAVGPLHDGQAPDRGPLVLDDGDVRTVQGRDWFESYDGCGGGFLTTTTRRGVRLVRVPGNDGPVDLVGTSGDRLVVAHVRDDCGAGGRGVLGLFDPRTREETVITRLGRRESWLEVLAATEVRGWSG